jgi:hypothetical protein
VKSFISFDFDKHAFKEISRPKPIDPMVHCKQKEKDKETHEGLPKERAFPF